MHFIHLGLWPMIFFPSVLAILLNVNDPGSVRNAAATVAYGMQSIYQGNKTGGNPGKWPYPPYFWWESGAAWGAMVYYWHYTGDVSYLNVTYNALVSQLGPAYDFNVPAEAFNEGNDDQAFWAFAAMTAAEYGFPAPPAPAPSWVAVVNNTWTSYVSRWRNDTCGGGLKWQFHPENAGYDYRNSISQGGFFQLSARLARYTGQPIYVEWAERIWNWTAKVGLIDNIYNVYDGTDDKINCTAVDHHQWTYNVGVFLYGAAVLQNYTNTSEIWAQRTLGLLDATTTFLFPYPNASNVIFEAQCELDQTCNVDQFSMKAYLSRWLAGTMIMAPYTAPRINSILRSSAMGAAAACTGGSSGTTCGFKWYINAYDGTAGLGQQMCALDVIQALLIQDAIPPRTLPNVTIAIGNSTIPTFTKAVTIPSTTSRPLHDQRSIGIRSHLVISLTSLVTIPVLVGLLLMAAV